jgi:Tn3 transposase DDE domain
MISPHQPRNRRCADVVAAADLDKRFLAPVAALDRLALLVRGELGRSAHFLPPRYGAHSAFARPRADKIAFKLRQNGLAVALREIGRLERTLFTLDWFGDPALRRRSNAGLNKGEARNALARAVFLHRLGEIRDRTIDNQSYRTNGLNLVVAAIILWNTVYIEHAVKALRQQGTPIPDELLPHIAPLLWEHINLTGDYIWKPLSGGSGTTLRPLRLAPQYLETA